MDSAEFDRVAASFALCHAQCAPSLAARRPSTRERHGRGSLLARLAYDANGKRAACYPYG